MWACSLINIQLHQAHSEGQLKGFYHPPCLWGQTHTLLQVQHPSSKPETNPAQGITSAGNYWDSFWGGQQTKQAGCHIKTPSVHIYSISYSSWAGTNPLPVHSHPSTDPSGKELLVAPWHGLSSAGSRLWHQQSCVSTRLFTIRAVLAK